LATKKSKAAEGEAEPIKAKASARAKKPAKGAKASSKEKASGSEPPASRPGDDAREPAEDGGDEEVVDADAEIVDAEVGADGQLEDVDVPESVAPKSSAALSRSDPMQAYLREIQRHPLLTPEQEQTLTRKYATDQDVATAAKLVTSNLRLVVKLAYEYRRAYKNIMDLVQEGNIGLMQAVKRYDPYRGVKLSSYAAWWIRAYILRFILNNWRLVKLGTTQAQRKLFFNLNKEKEKLRALGIDPEPHVIAERLGVEEKEVIDMDRRLSSGEASLDAPIGDGEGRSVSRLELLPSMGESPEADLQRSEMDALVKTHLGEFRKTLKGKDVIIFDQRMSAEDPLTLQQLGDEFGVSRERVRQLEARLTMKLRDFLKQRLGDAVSS
jgi:RNA polymerase sigma-32 factor